MVAQQFPRGTNDFGLLQVRATGGRHFRVELTVLEGVVVANDFDEDNLMIAIGSLETTVYYSEGAKFTFTIGYTVPSEARGQTISYVFLVQGQTVIKNGEVPGERTIQVHIGH